MMKSAWELDPAVRVDRAILHELASNLRCEWLVTNGIGGFACGTVGGIDTRRYHGLLVAALEPPLGRAVLFAKVEELVTIGHQRFELAANQWRDGTVAPRGFIWLESFGLEGTVPVWRYVLADAVLEKRVWMEHGANTTFVHYTLVSGSRPIALSLAAFVNDRDYHAMTRAGDRSMGVCAQGNALAVEMFEGVTRLTLHTTAGAWEAEHVWYRDVHLREESLRGFDALDDRLRVGHVDLELAPGDVVTIIASVDAAVSVDVDAASERQRAREAELWRKAGSPVDLRVRQLVLAADQFVVRRATTANPHGTSILAGYPWFGDWGRDTMIALPGLTLSTGRPELCRTILETFAEFVDEGMLPNRFPDVLAPPEYNTVDATLWYFEAIRQYVVATTDTDVVTRLMPVLEEIVSRHIAGTRYGIHVDADGLLFAGEAGVQLTWMDAKVGDWVVTPRIGKAIEVNALWYNALEIMIAFRNQQGRDAMDLRRAAAVARRGMQRFWNPARGYCFDVLDGPDGPESALRPNQLLAVSLHHSALSIDQQRSVVDACWRNLYTPMGLRSLAPEASGYQARYEGDLRQRDRAYHQGTVWSWLIGPFVEAHLRCYGDREQARRLLKPLLAHVGDAGLGSVSEIFDGEAPFTPRGCFAQAWGVAEVLRMYERLAELRSTPRHE